MRPHVRPRSRLNAGRGLRAAALSITTTAALLAAPLAAQPAQAHVAPRSPGVAHRATVKRVVDVRDLPPFRPSSRRHAQPFHPAPRIARSGPAQAPAIPVSKIGLELAAGPRQAPHGADPSAIIEDLGHFSAQSNTCNCAPPDTQVGVGNTQIVEMVNTAAAVYDKGGTQLTTFDLGTFYGGSAGQGTDPRVLFDAESGVFLAAYELLPSGGDEIDLAVTTNPQGSWTVYTVSSNSSQTLMDQPKLGVSSDKIVLSWNDYDNSQASQPFTGVETWVIQKSQILAHVTADAVQFGPDTGQFQVVPAQSMSPTGTEYAAAHYTNDSDLHVFTITGTPSNGDVDIDDDDVGIGSVSSPPMAAQPSGGDPFIQTNDDRDTHAVWRSGTLWTVFNEGCTPVGDDTNRACLRFVEVDTSGIDLSSNIQLGFPGGDIYYGAVMLDPGMDLYGGFTASSSSLFPTAVAMGVPGGNFPAVTIGAFYQSGTQAYVCNCGTTNGNPNRRWGDYSGIALDPVNTNDVWAAQEFGGLTTPANDWGTSIGRFTLYPPDVTSVSPSSGPENPADSSCNPTVTVSGDEFVPGGTSVKFGSASASSVNVLSSTQLTARAPSQAAGVVDVTVTTQNGTSPTSSADHYTYVADTAAPTTTLFSFPAPNGAGWNNSNVTANLGGVDDACGTGVKSITYSASGAQPIASTTVNGSSTNVVISVEGTTTLTWHATDNANNSSSDATFTVKLDKTGPVISIASPVAGNYFLNAAVAASYGCTDPVVSGIVTSCVGTVPNGSNIDTSTLGNHLFQVDAVDVADNPSSSALTYTVTYAIKLLYDPSKPIKGGNSSVPIKLQITDANGVNYSSPTIGLVATGIQTGNGTIVRTFTIPFKYDSSLGGYIVPISTKGLAGGDYNLTFTVAGDGVTHLAPFRIK